MCLEPSGVADWMIPEATDISAWPNLMVGLNGVLGVSEYFSEFGFIVGEQIAL